MRGLRGMSGSGFLVERYQAANAATGKYTIAQANIDSRTSRALSRLVSKSIRITPDAIRNTAYVAKCLPKSLIH